MPPYGRIAWGIAIAGLCGVFVSLFKVSVS
jgi:hypothetical protein